MASFLVSFHIQLISVTLLGFVMHATEIGKQKIIVILPSNIKEEKLISKLGRHNDTVAILPSNKGLPFLLTLANKMKPSRNVTRIILSFTTVKSIDNILKEVPINGNNDVFLSLGTSNCLQVRILIFHIWLPISTSNGCTLKCKPCNKFQRTSEQS